MHSITNSRMDPDPRGDDSSAGRMLLLSCLSRKGLRFLPELRDYVVWCEGARIEAQVEVVSSPENRQGHSDATCRVYTVQVFALNDDTHASGDKDSIARYQLNVDPDSALGIKLGEVFKPHIGLAPAQKGSGSNSRSGEQLLRTIDALVLDTPSAKWFVFPTDPLESTIERKERTIGAMRKNAGPLRVLPSLHEFVTNRSSLSARFLTTKTFEHRDYVLETILRPEEKSLGVKLCAHNKFGVVVEKEIFTLRIDKPSADEWLQRVKDRVYGLEEKGAPANERLSAEELRDVAKQLREQADNYSEVFRKDGPQKVSLMLDQSGARREGKEPSIDPEELAFQRRRDREILGGIIDPSANLLGASANEDSGGFLNHIRDFRALVHLEVGSRVARVSVNSTERPGSATIAWHMRSPTPFSAGDTSKLVEFWRAAEMLRSPSEGAVYFALETLCNISSPNYRGATDPQDILNFDVSGIDGVVFTSVTPVLFSQMARVVEGTEDINATVIQPEFRRNYPGNFYRIRFSLHRNGALSIQAINSFKGTLTAFIPTDGFDELGRSRSEVIEHLSTLMTSNPETGRRALQVRIASLAQAAGGWHSSVGNGIDAPGAANDLPSLASPRGDLAYGNAVSIAKIFCECTNANPDSIAIKLLKAGSIRPTRCRFSLTEPNSRITLSFIVDHVGIKRAAVRPGVFGSKSPDEMIIFARRSNTISPFRSEEDVRSLFLKCRLLGDEYKRYQRELKEYERRKKEDLRNPQLAPRREVWQPPPHMQANLSDLIDLLSRQMKRDLP